ncbi:unnamed protein product [Paramecium sonneborni]|uniref:Uncharacterized protein n=1 Tax=Paramecium sonneborni TaxID=65129 RepID=A0A8S1MN26_9CILI|nr:unnamed protein product [Paramecium sonneborni]
MDKEIFLVDLEVNQLSIESIYSLTWKIMNETQKFFNRQNIFVCPHTVKIKGKDNIIYQPRNCEICQFAKLNFRTQNERYKYMICGIIYFLVEGKNTLNKYYESQNFFFFNDVIGSFYQNEYVFRSFWQIMEKQDYIQKKRIMEKMPKANQPILLKEFEFQRFRIIIIDPCLGGPTQRLQESNLFQLISFQRLLIDLQNIQRKIGMDNPLPPPCYHNIFIGRSFGSYCQFRINIFQTNPHCRCQNFKLGTILYGLLIGNKEDQFMDDSLIKFSRDLISRYEFNNPQQQFQQYQEILDEIYNTQYQFSQIIENVIDASFYANLLRNHLKNIQEGLLWRYYKILFLQEMIELIENRILNQPFDSIYLLKLLLQLKDQQCQRITNYIQISNNNLLTQIQNNYLQQIQNNQNLEIEEQQGQNNENLNQTPQLFQIRWNLFQQFSEVNAFNDPNNQIFRNQFQNTEFNHNTIIDFEDRLQND